MFAVVKPVEQEQSTSTTTTSSSTNNRKQRKKAEFLHEIAENYLDIFGRQLPRLLAREIIQQMDDYGEKNVFDWYLYALRETISAPVPSWRYTETIVDRLIHGGSMTRRKKPQKVAPAAFAGKAVTEQQYQQREYTDDSQQLPPWMRELIAQTEKA